MLIELLTYIMLLSILSGIAVPVVIDIHANAYKTIEQIKYEYKK